MGLDMYLWNKKYLDVYDFKKEKDYRAKKIKVKVETEFADGEVKTVEYETDKIEHSAELLLPYAYWRKANQIHRWILENTNQEDDDCRKIYIDGDKLKELVAVCEEVLADHSKAPELLPTQEGFFFGSYEYDEWYFQDLENTIRQLKDVKEDEEYVYQASW